MSGQPASPTMTLYHGAAYFDIDGHGVPLHDWEGAERCNCGAEIRVEEWGTRPDDALPTSGESYCSTNGVLICQYPAISSDHTGQCDSDGCDLAAVGIHEDERGYRQAFCEKDLPSSSLCPTIGSSSD